MSIGPMEDYFSIDVDGRWYGVDWSWHEEDGNYTLLIRVYLGPGNGIVPPDGDGGGDPFSPPIVPTLVDSREFPMGPDGPMACDGCDRRRVRDLIDPNGNGRPYWADAGDRLRPNFNID